MKKMIERWKRGTRSLKIYDQKYGEQLVSLLERYNSPMLRWFDDYLEAATFVLLIGLLRELETRNTELTEGTEV